MHPYLMKSATELARLIRDGETTSEEVVRLHIDRLRRVNPALNAVVRVRVREAMSEAREARSKYSAPECGSDNAAAQLGELQSEVLAQLPREANERLVYECNARN